MARCDICDRLPYGKAPKGAFTCLCPAPLLVALAVTDLGEVQYNTCCSRCGHNKWNQTMLPTECNCAPGVKFSVVLCRYGGADRLLEGCTCWSCRNARTRAAERQVAAEAARLEREAASRNTVETAEAERLAVAARVRTCPECWRQVWPEGRIPVGCIATACKCTADATRDLTLALLGGSLAVGANGLASR